MKNLLARLFLLLVFLAPVSAFAQSTGRVVADCTTGVPLAYPVGTTSLMTMLADGRACVNAAVSASITGFPTLQSTGTPISVTTGGVTGTLPTGAVVVASNTGTTNNAYCKLGASATTSDQMIPPSSWFAFTVGAATQLTCITSTSTTTVNMVGGSGLPTGAGGGGGGSGGGAVTLASGAVASGAYSSGSIASGAFASGSVASGAFAAGSLAAGAGVDGWDLTQGAIADAAVTAGATGSVSAKLRAISRDLGTVATNSALPLPTQSVGVPIGGTGLCDGANGTTNPCTTMQTVLAASTASAAANKPAVVALHPSSGTPASLSPYPFGATPYTATATGTTGATTATLAGAASVTTYICGFSIRANATAAATGNATVTGVITATLNFTQWTAPNASGLGVTEMIFSPCIPASGTNQSVAVVSAAPGTGGVVSVTAWGYKL